MAVRRLVLDANILIRAVLGKRVRDIITTYATDVEFFAPEIAYDDAHGHLPDVLTKFSRDDEVPEALALLALLREIVRSVPEDLYIGRKAEALARIETRDADDWPIVAAALVFDCPVWTEDNDFFGTGIPTWTTDRVELYLKPGR